MSRSETYARYTLFKERWKRRKGMGSKGSASQYTVNLPQFYDYLAEVERQIIRDSTSEYDEIMKAQALMEQYDGVAGEDNEQKPAAPEA